MFIQNMIGSVIYLSSEISLPADENVELDNNIYSSDPILQNQIDQLYLHAQIIILGAPEGFPLSIEQSIEPFVPPASYTIESQDLILSHGDGLAALAVDSYEGSDYGSVKLSSSNESKVGLCSDVDSAAEGMIYAYKSQDQEQNFFDIKQDGFKLTLDPATEDAESLANFLIGIGLAEAE